MDNKRGIENSWSLVSFARSHGTPKLAKGLKNSETGEEFDSLAFDNGGCITFVGFSSKLGSLSTAEIARDKDNLQVVLLTSGSYKLCRKGEGWETIDLGL